MLIPPKPVQSHVFLAKFLLGNERLHFSQKQGTVCFDNGNDPAFDRIRQYASQSSLRKRMQVYLRLFQVHELPRMGGK